MRKINVSVRREFVMSASGFEVARGKFQDEKRKYAKAIHLIVIVISALRIIYYNSYNNNNNNSKKSIFIIDFEVRWCVCVNFFVFSLFMFHVCIIRMQTPHFSFCIMKCTCKTNTVYFYTKFLSLSFFFYFVLFYKLLISSSVFFKHVLYLSIRWIYWW